MRVHRAPQGPGGHDDWNAGRSPQPGVLPTCWGCLGHGDPPGRGAKAAGPASALGAPWKLLRFPFLSAGKTYPFFSRLRLVKGWDLGVGHALGTEAKF